MTPAKNALAFAVALFTAVDSAAAEGFGDLSGYLDVFWVPIADLEVKEPGFGAVDDDGDGHGFRALVRPGRQVAVYAEVQRTSHDSRLDHDQVRAGVGLTGPSAVDSGAYAEYLDVEFEGAKTDGLALHVRLGDRPTPALLIQGDIGYMRLAGEDESFSGWELAAGAGYELAAGFALFVDFRNTALRGRESRVDLEVSALRIGGRVSFGGRPQVAPRSDPGQAVSLATTAQRFRGNRHEK